MRVTLKQSDVIKGIALYLGSIGMASVNASELVIDFSIARKDNAGLTATFDIPDRTSVAQEPVSCSGSFHVEDNGTVNLNSAELAKATIVEETSARAEAVGDTVKDEEPTPVDPEPELAQEPETVVDDAPATEAGKVSLFG